MQLVGNTSTLRDTEPIWFGDFYLGANYEEKVISGFMALGFHEDMAIENEAL